MSETLSAGLAVEIQGTGRPLLLVHGFPLDHTMWSNQIRELADEFQVIAPDLRGFGRSAAMDQERWQMADFANDLNQLLDALQIQQPVVLCGLSMGGYVSWEFARLYPRRLAGLILCDTLATQDPPEAMQKRHENAVRVLKEGPAFLVEMMLPRLFGEAATQAAAPYFEATRQVMLNTAPKTIAAALRGMAERPDSTPLLPTLNLPALVLGGATDVISPPAAMQAFAAKMPHATWLEVAGAGHMAPLEQPQVVTAAIRSFIHKLA